MLFPVVPQIISKHAKTAVDGRIPAPFKSHGKPLFVGIYRGILIPGGFLGGAGFRPSTVSLLKT